MGKLLFMLIAVLATTSLPAQTLKELLYSGKLKKDSTGVIRKTDDLSAMVDTSKQVSQAAAKTPAATPRPPADSTASAAAASPAKAVVVQELQVEKASTASQPNKTNTRIWKDFYDDLYTSMKSGVLQSKKIRKGSYFVTVDYNLEPGGGISVLGVTVSPENDVLAAAIRQALDQGKPVLNPTEQPKALKRKYNFTIEKD